MVDLPIALTNHEKALFTKILDFYEKQGYVFVHKSQVKEDKND